MRRIFLALFLLPATFASAQLGGQSGFRVLSIPSSARASALGGNYIAVKDNDINLGIFDRRLGPRYFDRQGGLSRLS